MVVVKVAKFYQINPLDRPPSNYLSSAALYLLAVRFQRNPYIYNHVIVVIGQYTSSTLNASLINLLILSIEKNQIVSGDLTVLE